MNAKVMCVVAVWVVARVLLVADLDIRYDVPRELPHGHRDCEQFAYRSVSCQFGRTPFHWYLDVGAWEDCPSW